MEGLAKKDLTAVKVGEDWYNVAQDRNKWSAAWSQHLGEHQQEQRASGPIGEKTVLCRECGRWFRREADKTRHKCAAERRRPVCEQGGALQCEGCQRWFRSRGGLAVLGAGERSQKMTTVEQQRTPRAEWNAQSALDPLATRVISRDTSAFVNEAIQCKNSEVPYSV